MIGLNVNQEVSGQSRLPNYWDQLEYWEESWRSEETCCHSSERPPASVGEKNSQGVNQWYICEH